jgi:hypothetical protein
MSVTEKQTFVTALNGGMIGKHFPTTIDDSVLDPLKNVLKNDLNSVFLDTQVAPELAPLSDPEPAPNQTTPAMPAGNKGGPDKSGQGGQFTATKKWFACGGLSK